MQPNQVYVIQVNTNNNNNNKGALTLPLALPPPPGTILPSEVKYSASLVRGLGGTHLVLGTVLFLLGVLGSWVEPETCWSGAGVWGGIFTIICGMSGLFAYHLWYKNYTIKAFLVSSVVCVVISILAIILIIYALVNRREHYYYLIQQAEKQPWFKPYNNTSDEEHQLTISVSANLMVGFILELLLAVWSVKVGWKGVRAEEFTTRGRDSLPDDLQSIVSTTQQNGQQVPLAALYQLIQAHPELMGSKATGGGLGSPWVTELDDRPSHRSMDYQERVSRYLSHAIEDQNPSSFSRSPSTIQGDHQHDNPSPNEGRGSPSSSADTAVILPEATPSSLNEMSAVVTSERPNKSENRQEMAKTHTTKIRIKTGEPKSKAPLPKEAAEKKVKDALQESREHKEILVDENKENQHILMSEKSVDQEEKHKKKSKEKRAPSKENDERNCLQTKDDEANKKSTDQEEKQKKKSKEKRLKESQENFSQPKDEQNIPEIITEEHSLKKKHKEKSTTSKENEKNNLQLKEEQDNEKSSLSKDEKNMPESITEEQHSHKKKHKEKKPESKENEKNNLQLKEEQDNASTRNLNESTHPEKTEKNKKSKKEKQSHIAEEEPGKNKDHDAERKEKKKHKKHDKHGKSRGSTLTNDHEDAKDSSKVITEGKSKTKDSENSEQYKDVTEQVIDIKPPCEFQDSGSGIHS